MSVIDILFVNVYLVKILSDLNIDYKNLLIFLKKKNRYGSVLKCKYSWFTNIIKYFVLSE